MIIVHEQRHEHGALPFGEITKRMPRNLLTLMYSKETATPLYDGEAHGHVSVLVMLNMIMGNRSSDETSGQPSKVVQRWARELLVATRWLAPSGASGADESTDKDRSVLLHPTMRTQFQVFRAKAAVRWGKLRRARRSLAGFDAESGARELTFKDSPGEPEAASAELRTPSSRV